MLPEAAGGGIVPGPDVVAVCLPFLLVGWAEVMEGWVTGAVWLGIGSRTMEVSGLVVFRGASVWSRSTESVSSVISLSLSELLSARRSIEPVIRW